MSGVVQPWHILILLCCLLTVAGAIVGLVFAVRGRRRSGPGPSS